MLNNTTVVAVRAGRNSDFYDHWVEFLSPLHGIRQADKPLLAELLRRRDAIARKCTEDMADSVLFSQPSRVSIRETMGVTRSYLNVMLTHLRRCGAIKDGRVNPRLVPRFNGGEDDYKLIVHFMLSDERAD